MRDVVKGEVDLLGLDRGGRWAGDGGGVGRGGRLDRGEGRRAYERSKGE